MRSRLPARALALAVAALVAGCGSDGPSQPDQAANCTSAGQVEFVRTVLRDYYLWYREMPDPDPRGFASPEQYLDAVRVRPQDESFSYIAPKAESDAFFSDSQFIGFGFRTSLLAADDFRVVDVFAGSPAAAAGFQRGARILEVNGRSVADLVASGQLGNALGPNQVGVSARFRFANRGGDPQEVTMAKALVTIPTVAVAETFRVGGRTVGYLLFQNFVRPSTEALDAAFARFAEAGVSELVLDLRYNGGGLINVAQHLAGLIGGQGTSGQAFVRFVHNDKQRSRDSTLPFPLPANALGIERLVVITTRSSASASELVVNALRPFIEVTVVGDRTYGKPVGQYGFDFCEKTFFPVAFSTRNARDEGDYFGGIPADCPAPDDFGHDLGDPAEGSLAEALGFLRTGQCSAAAGAQARAQARLRPPFHRQPHQEDGWRSLLGAY